MREGRAVGPDRASGAIRGDRVGPDRASGAIRGDRVGADRASGERMTETPPDDPRKRDGDVRGRRRRRPPRCEALSCAITQSEGVASEGLTEPVNEAELLAHGGNLESRAGVWSRRVRRDELPVHHDEVRERDPASFVARRSTARDAHGTHVQGGRRMAGGHEGAPPSSMGLVRSSPRTPRRSLGYAHPTAARRAAGNAWRTLARATSYGSPARPRARAPSRARRAGSPRG
mgnify:CR=1 FL=1